MASPAEPLTESALHVRHRGKVVDGSSHVSHAALMRAREVGAAAVVVAGFDDRDLRELLGRDLGVAITGSEDIGFTLVLTEGFGHIRMAERAWKLLTEHDGALASVSGATQIRAGVMRPEILIPRREQEAGAEAEHLTGLEIGSLLRVIRQPHFGRIGHVVELPPEHRTLESEASVRVLVVQFGDDGTRAMVPRANVERNWRPDFVAPAFRCIGVSSHPESSHPDVVASSHHRRIGVDRVSSARLGSAGVVPGQPRKPGEAPAA